MYQFHYDLENTMSSPDLVYDLGLIQHNIDMAIANAGGADVLWPHVKTHKCADIVNMLIKAGIRKFKASTLAEAEMCAACYCDSVILAMPLVGPNIREFAGMIKRWPHTEFYAIVDNLYPLKLLSQTVETPIRVLVDVNTGQNRTGVKMDQLDDFYREASCINNVHLCGFHCYDGHIHMDNRTEREDAVSNFHAVFEKVYEKLIHDGYDCSVNVFGGSPTAPCHLSHLKKYKNGYISPGTIFIYDYGYKTHFTDLPYEPACAVMTRVISHPEEGVFTLDLGYKHISAESPIAGVLPEVPHANALFQNEEHWVFKMEDGYEAERPDIGAILYAIPYHVCPTTILYDHITAIYKGSYFGSMQVSARDKKYKGGRDV